MNGSIRLKWLSIRVLLCVSAAALAWGVQGRETVPLQASQETIVAASAFVPEGAPEAVNRWARLLTGPGLKAASLVKETSDGGIVFDSETNAYGAQGKDFWIFKLDNTGAQAWAYVFGTAEDNGGAAQPTDDGGYIVGGWTSGGGGTSPWIMKLDSNASITWQKNYSLAVSFGATGLSVSKMLTDGYLLSGLHMDLGSASFVFDLVKIDLSGNILWQKSYSATNKMINGGGVTRLGDGSLMVGGTITDLSTQDSDFYLMKLTSTGDVLWSKTYGGPLMDVGGTGVILTQDGGFFTFGQTKSWGMGGTPNGIGDLWALKLDSSGDIQWQKAYGGTGDELGTILVDQAGGYFIGGTTDSWGAGKNDIWAAKLDSNGSIVWQKVYGGPEDDYGAVLPDPSAAGYILSGVTESFGHGGKDEWDAKLDASGNMVWQWAYGTSLEEEGAGYRLLPSGDMFIEGYSKAKAPPTPTQQDFWAIRASSTGNLGVSCPFISAGTAVTGTASGVATVTTATPVTIVLSVGSPGYTASAGALTRTAINTSPTDLCSGATVCTLSCTATVPGTGTTSVAVSFASTATPSSCTGTPTYDWNFGDGTAHATVQNPSHSYGTAGSFNWSLTVTVDGVPCSQSGTINISGGGGASTLTIGTSSGTAGASVCVDVTLTNSGTPAITAFTTDITYNASMLTPTGATTPVAGKLIGGNIVSAGTYRITLYGGTGTLANGTVANVCFATTAGQCSTYPLGHAAGTPTASDASANPVAITGTAGSITTTGCGGCTLSCTATVPATGSTSSAVAFASTATPNNCIGTPSFDWNFGDGTAHSASQNTSHTYASAGTFNWVLTTSVNGVPCTKNGSIVISGGAGVSGSPWAWGYNSSGQVGDGFTIDRLSPVAVSGLSSVSAFEAGEAFSLALKGDGTLAAWGYNFFGQLGNGTWTESSLPVSVSSLTGVTAIAAGRNFALARKSDGSVWAWGHNSTGQLGNGVPSSNLPVVVSGLTGVMAVACGEEHSIALKSDGTVWTWGSNFYGQLGNGSSGAGSNPTPQQVTSLTNIADVKAGNSSCLAIKSDGTVWAWGYNYNGQLGDGTTTMRTLPVQVSGLTGITAVSAGYAGCLARKSDGTVWTWGWNGSSESHVPVQITSLAGATQVAAGYLFAMVLKSDGTVWTWGRNTHGQLGDGTLTWHDSPVQVTGLGYAVSIAAGDYHALAVTGIQPCVLTCTATVPATGVTGAAVSCASSATLTGCTGTPTYAWTFGDGATSNLQNPTHAYSAAGSFNWTLDVSAAGQACSKSGSIVISTPLSASASADKTTGTAPLAVTFTGSASGGVPPYTYSWTLGDGSTSTAQSPSHTFTQAGSFTAVLTVADSAAHTAQAPGVTITVANPVAPPVVTLIKKSSPPFKLSVMGGNLQNGIKVYIDGAQWGSVIWKNTGKIQLTGAIKTAVPKGTVKTFRFLNPDGGETTTTWGW